MEINLLVLYQLRHKLLDMVVPTLHRPIHALVEAMAQPVWTSTGAGAVDFVNSSWQSHIEFVPQSMADLRLLMHASLDSHQIDPWSECLTKGEPFQFSQQLRRRDGIYRWYLLCATPIHDEHGNLCWMVICNDIHEQKNIEEAQRFLAEASGILAGTLDYEATLERVGNLAVASLSDWCIVDLIDPNDLWQRKCVAHADNQPAALALRLRTFAPKPESDNPKYPPSRALRERFPTLIIDANETTLRDIALNDEHFQLLVAMRLRSVISVPMIAHGRVLGVITLARSGGSAYGSAELAIAEDLAHRSALAADNARLYREAQDAIKLREDFLAIASHELRTPLTSLLLQADGMMRHLCKQTPLTPERMASKIDRILKQAERLQRLVDNLLDVSRLAKGSIELYLRKTDFTAVAHEVVSRYQDEAGHAGCNLTMRDNGPILGHWDKARIEQLIGSFLANAIRYGRGKPIDVHVDADADMVRLRVHDHGIGIAPADHERIFGRFERASSEQNYGGLGLGLWLVRQIVNAMHGSVRVESQLGNGALFTVELPR